jgi:prevent-host-death family protein
MARWQLQEAKARFSQVVKSAMADGPQEITVHGRPAAVVLSAEEYARLAGGKLPFVEFIRQSPLFGTELFARRDKSVARRVRL